MIEFEKDIRVFSYKLEDIYCCDCVFEKVIAMVFNQKKFSGYNEFLEILQKKFPKDFLFMSFSGMLLIVCKDLLKFILKNKKEQQPVFMKSCFVDSFIIDDELKQICIVCLIKIVATNRILNYFKLKDKYRNEIRHLFL